jgi:Tol biopolymer transport system component/tRNA A-37 threonylcarbamoyl transferase component Bud32
MRDWNLAGAWLMNGDDAMSADRWRQVESLYHVALTWEPAVRAERLAAACQGDTDLCREVSELLEHNDRPGNPLDRLPWQGSTPSSAEESGVTEGATLGPYVIESPLGVGGMGQVWKARDPRLNRTVAIKISKAQFSSRVEREAKAVAALNHPNVGGLYDVGVAPSGFMYLVLEYVDGPTLANRISRGPMSLTDLTSIVRQLADAIEAAHERGIVHRDLKPANIKLRPDGTLKVLDFGLAKALEQDVSSRPAADVSGAGTIMGTAAYMSPEQARGEIVDKRTDIWAFGVLLYEMLVGKRPFAGDTVTDVLASVLREDPDLSRVPLRFRTLIQSCLEKDPRRRLRDIGDAMRLIADDDRGRPRAAHWSGWLWPAAAATIALIGAVMLLLSARRSPAAVNVPMSFQVVPPGISTYGALALSPDGRKLAFSGRGFDGVSRLWVRDFNSLAARSIPEADGIVGAPIWSPDARYLAFTSSGKLKKIDASGGSPLALCDWPGSGGVLSGVWNREDMILFSRPTGGLQRVSASGGACSDVTASGTHPSLLPDGRHFLYFRPEDKAEKSAIYVGVLGLAPAAQSSEPLLTNEFAADFVQSADPARGYLLFSQSKSSSAVRGALVAQPFDIRQLRLGGDPVAVPVTMAGALGNGSLGMLFSFSSNGTLAYSTNGTGSYQNVWYDRTGRVIGTVGDPGDFGDVSLSPDETVAVIHNREGTDDLVLFDLARRVSSRLTTSPDRDHEAVWSPDGRRIIWSIQRATQQLMYVKASNATGEERLLLSAEVAPFSTPTDWSQDGHTLLYVEGPQPSREFKGGMGRSIKILRLQADGTPAGPPEVYLKTASQSALGHARFSPNGRWVAYTVEIADVQNVYISPFPVPKGREDRWAVSSGGGYQPLWRRDGKELLYFSSDSTLMAVDVDTTSAVFHAGVPKPLFAARIAGGPPPAPTHRWDLAHDGQRFLITTALDITQSPPITIVTNWESGLK